MHAHYCEFKQKYYDNYPQLGKHFEHLWECCCFWALSFHSQLHMRGNNANNYIERSFGILKDIVFARTQAYNRVQVFQLIIMKMERFYVFRLLSFTHRHTGHLRIAKWLLCPGWDTVDMNSIQKSSVENDFFVNNVQNADVSYIVNSEITCTCPVGINGAPYKHQGAVSIKFHISTFNFLSSLNSNDHMLFAYVELGYTAKDSSFYASLYAKFVSQGQEVSQTKMEVSTSSSNKTKYREPNENEEIDISTFDLFVEEIKEDHQSSGVQFRTFDKFAECYKLKVEVYSSTSLLPS